MKILLHDNSLNIRGTSVAVYDYALFLEEKLNHECIIAHSKLNEGNDLNVINKFKKRFNVCSYEQFNEIDKIISKNNIDFLYLIKAGENDKKISSVIKNGIHAVFNRDISQVHGHVYAFVSEWLSQECNNQIPYVPHMINLPVLEENFKKELNIPKDAIVFGRYGGYDSFDISFVYNTIHDILNKRKDIYFLFCNTLQFIKHPQVIFTNSTTSLHNKVKFINTCDALLHARQRGETFGLTVLEFMSRNKPVFTYANSPEKNHYLLLKNKGYYYNNSNDLSSMLTNFTSHTVEYANIKEYFPDAVIKKFDEVFLKE